MSADSYHKRKLGNRVLQPETQMMGYGYDPTLSEGSLKPPIFLTSTFVFRNAQDGKDFFDYTSGRRQPPPGQAAGLVYSRFNNPNLEVLEDRLGALGRRRSGVRVLERHVGDFHHVVGLSQAQRRAAHERAAVRRHRDAHRQDHAGFRHRRAARGGCHQSRGRHGRRESGRGEGEGQGRQGRVVSHRDAGQSHQQPGGPETLARSVGVDCRRSRAACGRRWPWTTRFSGPCSRSRSSMAPISSCIR